MDWLKKLLERIRAMWTKSTMVQKIVLFSIIGVVILAIILAIAFSAAPSMVSLIRTAITDENALNQITSRLDEEGIDYQVTSDNRIDVPDEQTALRARGILIRENLMPETDPWALFDVERWTTTDFERNVNLRRSITANVEQMIEALGDVDNAQVTVNVAEDSLFAEQQDPNTAVVVISARPGSDILSNRQKIEGIQRIVQLAVPGVVDPENISILDDAGNILNDFASLEPYEQLDITQRQIRINRNLEAQYMARITAAFIQIYGANRFTITNCDIAIDWSQRSSTIEEHTPIVMRADDPTTPYNESEVQESITISQQDQATNWTGTGFNPEGPAGVEGQTPPSYPDMNNLVGTYENSNTIRNNAINTRETTEESPGWEIRRVTCSVAIDGTYDRVYDDQGRVQFEPDGSVRVTYNPLTQDELGSADALLRDAVGYDANRLDSVTVMNVPFNHTDEWLAMGQELRRGEQVRMTILYAAIGLGALLLAFLAFRLISREVERRKRLREEELSRQHQAMREAALRSAEEEGVQVELSVEERARLEMQENAINLAREHPEDVAQLIRTWLLEE